MECVKKNFITKTLQRCRSVPGTKSLNTLLVSNKTKCKIAPHGCFTVYVGPEKQRFVIKTAYANHPLFKMLLEDAEVEYGFISNGPILLPCDVDLFYKVLAEMDCNYMRRSNSCGLSYGPFGPFSPARRKSKGFGSYGLLTPSRLVRMN